MIRIFLSALGLILLANFAHAQASVDSLESPVHRFSISTQIGLANTISGAEVHDRYFYPTRGNFRTTMFSTGLLFRWYLSGSFFLQARGAFSLHNEFLDDSIVGTRQQLYGALVTGYSDYTSTGNYFYKSHNLLVAVGGGHELRVRNFVVRAGGEIEFMKYLTQQYYFHETRNGHTHYDTIANGATYDYYSDFEQAYDFRLPQFWGIGIAGHASLEYKVSDAFGIGATLVTGLMYSAALKGKLTQTYSASQHTYDTDGLDEFNITRMVTTSESSQQQFKMIPLNAQINFVFCFGKKMGQ